MPYTLDNLPENVKKLSKDEQEKWVKTFNAALENYKKDDPKTAEEKAFATANAGVKKDGKKEADEKCMVCDAMSSATSFEELEVAEDTMEKSAEMEKLTYQTERLFSNVMRSPEIEDKPSALSKIVDGLKSRLSGILGKKERELDKTIFCVTKDKNGDYRWFTLYSNIFRDTDNPPEIFETKAHKEFIEYIDKGGTYPEFWLWHTPGTKAGKADWVDFDDGFSMASGTFDSDKKDIAEKLMKDAPKLGVSHGFNYRYSNKEKGIIGWYRTYEISVLPKEKAANPWAGIDILKMEANMNKEKRKFLVDKLGEERVKELESRPAELSKSLKEMGIEYKEVKEETSESTDNKEKIAVVTDGHGMKEAVEAAVKAITESETFKGLVVIVDDLKSQKEKDTKTITDLQTQVKEMGETIKSLQKSDDEKIAQVLTPRSSAAGLKRASESKENLVTDKDKELQGDKAAPSWLGAALAPVTQGK